MDIASVHTTAIVNGGKPPRWLLIFSEENPNKTLDDTLMVTAAHSAHSFGADADMVTDPDSFADVTGAIVNMRVDGSISRLAFATVCFFFARDGSQANVFVYNRFLHNFSRQPLEYFRARNRYEN